MAGPVINPRQAQMIAGMTGQNPYATAPQQPSVQIDQGLQDRLYQKAMADHMHQSQMQQHLQNTDQLIQNIDPQMVQNPPARFQGLKKKIESQQSITSHDIRATTSPTQALTPDQESGINAQLNDKEQK